MTKRERICLVAFVVVGTLMLIAIRKGAWKTEAELRGEQEAREFTLAQLNRRPTLPTPPVLVLEGFVDGHPFQTTMRGYDYYFCKETWGSPRGKHNIFGSQKPGGYRVELCVKDFHGNYSLRWWKYNGGRGGGSGGYGFTNWIAPGRLLWSTNGFVGAQVDGQFCKEWYATEMFRSLHKRDSFQWPGRIHWNSGTDRPTRIYNVNTFRFTNEPSASWFVARMNDYFPKAATLTNMANITESVEKK